MRLVFVCLLSIALAMSVLTSSASAQVTPEQQQKVVELNTILRQASGFLRSRRDPQAAEAVGRADALLTELNASVTDAGAKRFLANFQTQLDAMKKNLADRGVEIPGAMAAPNAPANPTNPGNPAPASPNSFTGTVAPMLNAKCGRCHSGNNARGGFNLGSYAALMRGANGLRVVQPRQGKDSRIVEVIESGDMPRGGAKVTPQELQALIAWIDAGATFDGTDPNGPLIASATPTPNQPAPERLMVQEATGNEKISFSADIAPVLAANCVSCHGDNGGADLNLSSFTRLLRGGDSGNIVNPGKGAASLIVMKLKGTAPDGARMPLRRPPLPDDVIAKFETWINEGAKFDGPSPDMPTETVAAVAAAKAMSHAELAAAREEQAMANWRLANPSVEARMVRTDHYTIVGNAPQSQLEEVGRIGDKVHGEVARLLGQPTDKPLIKGKLTIFVFDKRFEYAEFGTMVEKRELPRDWRGHYRYNVIDAYGALAPPDAERDSLERAIAEQVAGVYIESRGDVPNWFGVGVARAISARVDGQSPAVADWNERLPGIVAKATEPKDILNGASGPSDAAVAYYGLGKALLDAGRGAALKQFLQQMEGKAKFDDVFQATFRATPEQMVAAWASGGRRR